MSKNPKEILETLKPMLAEARAKGLWMHCAYQDLWFSPSELEAENLQGSFRWGPINWTLRDPRELLIDIDARIKELKEQNDAVIARINKCR